jgi:putative phosphoesterase
MRLLLISDLHANPWALHAVARDAESFDEVLCAGDVVNYGPDPKRTMSWLRSNAAITVRGNHDHAVAFGIDPKASPAKRELSLEMCQWTRDQLDPFESGWLLSLPRRIARNIGGANFVIVHGTPVDPLYDYRLTPDASNELLEELTIGVKADVLLVGHTHLPLIRRHRRFQIVNPGSVGQPLDGDPRAAYAIWDDGEIQLHRVAYDQEELLASISKLPIAQALIADLKKMLRRGSIG